MTGRMIPKDEWHAYFEQLNQSMQIHEARIEAFNPEIGDQIDAERDLISKIEYDPSSDELRTFNHHHGRIIQRPKQIYIVEEAGELKAMEVVDEANVKYVFAFKGVAALPHGSSNPQSRSVHAGKSHEHCDIHETPELAVCDRCGSTFPYVRELIVSDEEDEEVLCSKCRTRIQSEAESP